MLYVWIQVFRASRWLPRAVANKARSILQLENIDKDETQGGKAPHPASFRAACMLSIF